VKTGLKLQSSRQYDLDVRTKSKTCGFTGPGCFIDMIRFEILAKLKQ